MWPAETFSEQPTKATGFSPSWLVTTRRPARHTLKEFTMPLTPSSFLLTSESVSEGHPDKVADQVSTVLDHVLRHDPHGRVACETFIGPDYLIIGGRFPPRGSR